MCFRPITVMSMARLWQISSIASACVINFTSHGQRQTVIEYVQWPHLLNFGEQRRGADKNNILLFFGKAIEVMLYVLEKDYRSKTMGDVCLCDANSWIYRLEN